MQQLLIICLISHSFWICKILIIKTCSSERIYRVIFETNKICYWDSIIFGVTTLDQSYNFDDFQPPFSLNSAKGFGMYFKMMTIWQVIFNRMWRKYVWPAMWKKMWILLWRRTVSSRNGDLSNRVWLGSLWSQMWYRYVRRKVKLWWGEIWSILSFVFS